MTASAWRVGVSPFGTTRAGVARVAETAASGGIDTFWFGDGLLENADFPQWSGGLEAFTELAWLAGQHPGMRLGVGAAVIPLRDPFWTVRQAATLAHLSDAGVVLGLCPGFWPREFEYLGLDHAARGAALDELVPAVLALLAGEPFEGTQLRVPAHGRVSPSPPDGAVEVWMAGGRATFERALAHGLPFQASRLAPAALAPRAREWFDRGGGTLAVRLRVTVGDEPAPAPGGDVEWNGLYGSPAQIADAFAAYLALGVTDISIVPGQDDDTSLRTVTALVEEVLPQLRP